MPGRETRVSQWIVFGAFGRHDWSTLRQREQNIVERLSSDANVLYVERLGAHSLSVPEMWQAVRKRATTRGEDAEQPLGMKFLRPPIVPLHGRRWADEVNGALVARWVTWFSDRPADESVALVRYPSPYVVEALDRLSVRAVVYDASQRFSAIPEWFGSHAAQVERQLIDRAAALSCDSVTIQQEWRNMGRSCWRMPQGVPLHPVMKPGVVSARLADVKGRAGVAGLAGFLGAIGDVIDWSLVRRVASLLPSVAFTFVGPVYGSRVQGLPENILFFGKVGPDEVPAVLKQFDVGLIPYVVTDRTKSVFPTKLPEYLASGLRVVSTDLPDCRELQYVLGKPVVGIGSDAQSFSGAVREGISDGRLDCDVVEHIRRAFNWDHLLDEWREYVLSHIFTRSPDTTGGD